MMSAAIKRNNPKLRPKKGLSSMSPSNHALIFFFFFFCFFFQFIAVKLQWLLAMCGSVFVDGFIQIIYVVP